MINILLVEDHKLVRNGIKMLLESQENLHVIAEADSSEEALRHLTENQNINLVLTDINIHGSDGISLTKEIRKQYPEIKVIMLSMLQDNDHVSSSFDGGADAYIVKTADYQELLFAIPHIMQGGKYLCEAIMLDMIEQIKDINASEYQHNSSIEKLDISEREMEILQLIGEGFTNNEIADKLFLSKRTVEGHRQNLIDKTQVKNSAQLVKFAVKQGII